MLTRDQEVRETHAHFVTCYSGPDELRVVEGECPEPKDGGCG